MGRGQALSGDTNPASSPVGKARGLVLRQRLSFVFIGHGIYGTELCQSGTRCGIHSLRNSRVWLDRPSGSGTLFSGRRHPKNSKMCSLCLFAARPDLIQVNVRRSAQSHIGHSMTSTRYRTKRRRANPWVLLGFPRLGVSDAFADADRKMRSSDGKEKPCFGRSRCLR